MGACKDKTTKGWDEAITGAHKDETTKGQDEATMGMRRQSHEGAKVEPQWVREDMATRAQTQGWCCNRCEDRARVTRKKLRQLLQTT
jgi:hypothetical protein